MRISPNNIFSLKPGEVFVFGSNTQGRHGAGAALLAKNKFGAKYGQSKGLQGQSYAIITKDLTKPYSKQLKSISLKEIEEQVEEFICFAIKQKHLRFLVTEIGCNLAGYSVNEIAPMFKPAIPIKNIYLPASFWGKLLN